MAHGLSLELSEIKAPEWRPVDPAKLADPKVRHFKKTFTKKVRNQLWKRFQKRGMHPAHTITRGKFLAEVKERLGV